MTLKREEARKAEGVGYYTTYGSDATDVLGYLEADLVGLGDERPSYYDGRLFKVTVTVEEV